MVTVTAVQAVRMPVGSPCYVVYVHVCWHPLLSICMQHKPLSLDVNEESTGVPGYTFNLNWISSAAKLQHICTTSLWTAFATGMAAEIPLIALLVQVCPLTVPKYHMFKKATADQHYEIMGYQKAPNPKTGKEGFELPDRYLQRVGGYMVFYAAVMQSEQWPLRHPCSISAAWQFVAR